LDALVPLGAERRLAWGDGMELRVGGGDGAVREPLRTLRCVSGLGEYGLRFVEGTEVDFEIGGDTLLPVDLDVYTSNHDSGEISTTSVVFSDGMRLVLEESWRSTAEGWATLRGAPAPNVFELRKFQAPRRKDTAVRLALPTSSVRSVPLTIPNGRALDLHVGIHDPWHVSVAEATAEDDE
jgi:hypothetical protein